ncbi:Glucosamine-6-phosphate deaminase [compost metagenome]
MGIGTILKARQILLLARGAEKAEAIRKAVRGPITTECPASLLQAHPNVVVLLDEEAGQWVD